jgi:hypothetical protein
VDGELDRVIASASPPLAQQLGVHRAGLIAPEAVVERVTQTVDAEELPAPPVATVHERTMVGTTAQGRTDHAEKPSSPSIGQVGVAA